MSTGADYGVARPAVAVAWSRSLSSYFPTNTLNGSARLDLHGRPPGHQLLRSTGTSSATPSCSSATDRLLQRAVLRDRHAVQEYSFGSFGGGTPIPKDPPVQPRRSPSPASAPSRTSSATSAGARLLMAPTLVTGAAGFVGRHLLCRSSPPPVRCRLAPARLGATAAAAGVAWRAVELQDRAAVERALAARPAGRDLPLRRRRARRRFVGPRRGHAGQQRRRHRPPVRARLSALGLRPRVRGHRLGDDLSRRRPTPLTEDSPLAPNTPYGTSKLAQEMVAITAWREHGMPAVVTRSFNHIGPGQSPAFAAASFARQLALIEAGLASPTIAVGNLAAERDLSDVRDTVRAYIALMARGGRAACYNVCSGRAVSVQALLDGLRARVRVPVEVAIDPARMRPVDTPVIVGSHARLSRRHRLDARRSASTRPSTRCSTTGARGPRRHGLIGRASRAAGRLTRRTKSEIVRSACPRPRPRRCSTWATRRPTTRDIAALVKEGGVGGAARRRAARRPRHLPGDPLPLGAQPRRGHAVQVDAQPVPRVHPRLPLLLRPPLPAPARTGRGRRLRLGHLREDQLRGGAAARAGQAGVDATSRSALGTATDPVSADRRALRASPAAAWRRAATPTRRSASSPRGRWSCATSTC